MLIVQPLASLNSQKIRQCGARVIAESPERQFGQIAESQPQILARHCTEAGLIEKGAVLWGKAGQRSLERSALVEAMAQFTRALDQIATLPATPALRRKRIKLQVALINTLMHVKGYAAQETKAAAERARLLIERAETLGEPPEGPLLLFSVLYSFLGRKQCGVQRRRGARACRAVPGARREKRGDSPAHDWASPHGHFLSLHWRHRARASASRLDRAILLYDPAEHRPLATRFGQDIRVAIMSLRALACGCLVIPVLHSQIQTERLLMRARSAKPPP